MFHIDDDKVSDLLFSGNFGMEKEGLRITTDGYLSHTKHPFDPHHPNITRDFCENQTEINTPVCKSAEEVVEKLYELTCNIQQRLAQMDEKELWWPFSNPPYILSEEDIPVAQFSGDDAKKTAYRNYLSQRYGRYKMTYSGIHFNYSFSGDLLRSNYEIETGITIRKGEETPEYQQYVDRIYLDLAERLVEYGWIMNVLTAASPVMDNSFFELGRTGGGVFTGMGSPRCSEIGYWNSFAPLLDYTNIQAYADSIQWYVDRGLIRQPSELYYPVRLKPKGENSLQTLRDKGVNHIELRMIDLNPLCKEGIDLRDVKFAQLLLLWLASKPTRHLTADDQVQAVQNFKNASHYNLRTTHILMPDGTSPTVSDAAMGILCKMETFFEKVAPPQPSHIGGESKDAEIREILDYQKLKLTDSHNYRYTHIIRREYSDDFVKKGLELCANYSALAAANV